MTAPAIIEIEVASEARWQRRWRLVGPQVDVLVLHATPQALDEHVVQPTTTTVHADRHVVRLEYARERLRRELGALVGVEDLGCSVTRQRLLERLDAERAIERVRDPPREHAPRASIQQASRVFATSIIQLGLLLTSAILDKAVLP